MIKKYDIGIIGAGVSGAFASLKASEYDAKVIVFELGRPPGKRRRQLEGWMGCFPFSDAKIRISDNYQLQNIIDGRKTRHANKWVMDIIEEIGPYKIIKDKLPQPSIKEKITDAGFNIIKNDYIQWKPDSIHKLSRYIANLTEERGVKFSFDNEVYTINKNKNYFVIGTNRGNYICEKILLCVGRSGWRWVTKLYKNFNFNINDDISNYGIRVEIPSQYLKSYNKTYCTLERNDLTIGPFCWNGTVIPEDHADLAISAFRSNEDRWKSDKVSFQLIGKRKFKDNGVKETDRLGKLAFLMFNDRIGREKIKLILQDKSSISQLPEYDWLKGTIKEVESFIPTIISRGYFHAPTILPMASSIKLGPNLESELEGMSVSGESAGFNGLAVSAISGVIAINGLLK